MRVRHDLDDANVGRGADVLVLLHARKCAPAARGYARREPRGHLIVALTGTDLYGDLPRSRIAQRTLEIADRIVLLQNAGLRRLEAPIRRKCRVIHQSAKEVQGPDTTRSRSTRSHFEVGVIGHLRHVKDPMRCAMAVRSLPGTSRIRVTHVGTAMTPHDEKRALREEKRNPRYRWLGEISHAATRRRIAASDAIVLSSRSEGGANVIGEAAVSGVPILASRIEGTAGLLGARHPGLFPVGDTGALRSLLLRAESDVAWYAKLAAASRKAAPLFRPELELARWRDLLAELETG